MTEYRVTKYNPCFRSADGHFIVPEWTSISDIGRKYPAGVFQISDYLKTEDAYVETVRRFLMAIGVESLAINSLEMKDASGILASNLLKELNLTSSFMQEGEKISGLQIDLVVRLNLRELIWCRLEDKNGTYVHFGYDYYMYIGSKSKFFAIPELPVGIYAELFETPYTELDR